MGRTGKGKGRAVAHTDPEKLRGTCFRGRFPYVFVIFGPAWRPSNLLVFERKEEVELEWRKMNGAVGMLQEQRAMTLAEEFAGAEEWWHFIIFQHPQWPGRGPVRGLGGAF